MTHPELLESFDDLRNKLQQQQDGIDLLRKYMAPRQEQLVDTIIEGRTNAEGEGLASENEDDEGSQNGLLMTNNDDIQVSQDEMETEEYLPESEVDEEDLNVTGDESFHTASEVEAGNAGATEGPRPEDDEQDN